MKMPCIDFKTIITISNLYPRPDQPTRGVFNAQLFREMAAESRRQRAKSREQSGDVPRQQFDNSSTDTCFLNICLVPEWRLWRWPSIQRWTAPGQLSSCPVAKLLSEKPAEQSITTQQLSNTTTNLPSTHYLPVFYLPIIGRNLNWWFYYRALRRWYSRSFTAAIHHPTVFLASWLYPDAVAVARLAKDMGTPVWLRVHGTDRYHLRNIWRGRLIRNAVEYANGVICNASAVAEDLAKWGLPTEKIHVVPNGVDSSLFRYRNKWGVLISQGAESPGKANRSGRGLNSPTTEQLRNNHIILFVGNLVPIKGPDIMLKAFAALVDKQLHGYQVDALSSESSKIGSVSTTKRPINRSAILLVIGSGPMMEKLVKMSRELGTADRVHFLGNRPHEEVALWMNMADVLCLTSHSEGMPNVVVEALSSGLPVVATEVGACRELLNDEPVAKLCREADVVGIRNALRWAVEQEVNRESLALRQQGRYSWTKQAGTILGLMGLGK